MGHNEPDGHSERAYLGRTIRRVEYLTMANMGMLTFMILTYLGTNEEAAGNVLLLTFGFGMFAWFVETEPIYELRQEVRRDLREWWANR